MKQEQKDFFIELQALCIKHKVNWLYIRSAWLYHGHFQFSFDCSYDPDGVVLGEPILSVEQTVKESIE